jgi:hypothetical protein
LPVPWYTICCETKQASRSSAFSIYISRIILISCANVGRTRQ